MASQSLKFGDCSKAGKFKFLERTKHFFFKPKNLLFIKGYNMAKNSLIEQVTFKKTNNLPHV